jgi:Uma2 family endonuclease
MYICTREKPWNIMGFISLRIKLRDGCYRVPDLCVYSRPMSKERYPGRPPLLWIEILSEDDRMADVWAKAGELVRSGVPCVWIIDPHTPESQLWTPSGSASVSDYTLRLPETPIVIPLRDVMAQ